jgi:hypothetical protein
MSLFGSSSGMFDFLLGSESKREDLLKLCPCSKFSISLSFIFDGRLGLFDRRHDAQYNDILHKDTQYDY